MNLATSSLTVGQRVLCLLASELAECIVEEVLLGDPNKTYDTYSYTVIQPKNCAADIEHTMLKSSGHIYCWHCGGVL